MVPERGMRFSYCNTHYFLDFPIPLWEKKKWSFSVYAWFLQFLRLSSTGFHLLHKLSALRFYQPEPGASIHPCNICTGVTEPVNPSYKWLKIPYFPLQTLVKLSIKRSLAAGSWSPPSFFQARSLVIIVSLLWLPLCNRSSNQHLF